MDENEREDEEVLASVSYLVMKNSDDLIIDISIDDYDEQSMQGLTNILKMLSRESCVVETLEMVKGVMIESGNEDLFLLLLSKIGTQILLKDKQSKSDLDKPCISPSDMI
tara:strand:+ start:740 stop:1069 length:330 start_codon:yes stop_codon:yes gene_type:complete